MDLIAAAWKLSLYQVWNRKRRLVTLVLYIFPLVIVGAAVALRDQGGEGFYENFVPSILGAVLIPFVAIYWGSGAVSDEVEGKTLVYLWTRPRDRGLLLFLKMAGCWLWLVLLAAIGIGAAYVYNYSAYSREALLSNLMIIVWDLRALGLAAIAWSCVGFLLSVVSKRPLTYGLLIAYLWELVPQYGPGFLRRLSITQPMLALSTHKPEESGGMASRLIEQVTITESQAVLSMIGLAGLCAVAGMVLANRREFLSDDPARAQ